MLRVGEDLGGGAGLDDAARLHDADAVGDAADHAEVMADQQQGQAAGGFFSGQQVQDLRLDRDIERGGWLVGDQQAGVVGERHGDHDALALAAAELVGVGVEPGGGVGEAGAGEQVDDGLAGGRAAMQGAGLGDLAADAVQRVEAGHRLLKDDAGGAAADLAAVGFGEGLAREGDVAGGGGALGEQAQDRESGE